MVNGTSYVGKLTLQPIYQKMHIYFDTGQNLSSCIRIDYDCKYEYSFVSRDKTKKIKKTFTYKEQVRPYLKEYNSKDFTMTDVQKKVKSPTLILMGEEQHNDIIIDDVGNELDFDANIFTIPFVIEEGRIIEAFMGNENMGSVPANAVANNNNVNNKQNREKV